MPDKPMTFCKWKGCDELALGQYCPEHAIEYEKQAADADRDYQRERGSASARGYDRRWRDVRIRYMRAHPLCQQCQAYGRTKAAFLVHHIKPINEGGARYDTANLLALCNECHEEIHGKDRWKPRANTGEEPQTRAQSTYRGA